MKTKKRSTKKRKKAARYYSLNVAVKLWPGLALIEVVR